MDIDFVKSSFQFICQEFKRGKWHDVKSFTELVEATEFTQQRALRTLELTRLIRVDVSSLNVYLYA